MIEERSRFVADVKLLIKNIEQVSLKLCGKNCEDVRSFMLGITEVLKAIEVRGCLVNQTVTIDESKLMIAMLRSLPYDEYLKTGHWQSVRDECNSRFWSRCAICASDRDLDVHHRTYENIGCERSYDVVLLCRDCHGIFHSNGKILEKQYLASKRVGKCMPINEERNQLAISQLKRNKKAADSDE